VRADAKDCNADGISGRPSYVKDPVTGDLRLGRFGWSVQPGCRRLDFVAPDTERFPCLALAYQALRACGGAPAVLNAANEILVDAFLNGAIGYLDIPGIAAGVLDRHTALRSASLDDLLGVDAWARRTAADLAALPRTAASA